MARLIFNSSLAITISVIAGCGALSPPANLDSGITGIIQAGPTCPVVQPGMDCADKPIAATVIVRFSSTGLEATRFTTDSDGMFRVTLFPDRYVLDPQPAGFIGAPPSQTVDVQPSQFTDVVIEYDTGIR